MELAELHHAISAKARSQISRIEAARDNVKASKTDTGLWMAWAGYWHQSTVRNR